MANDAKRAAYLTDNWTLRDDLRFSDFCPALRHILTEAQTPLTVGVFGPWGSGKTSLLRMLKGEIDAQGLHFVRTVWFTAWKYDRYEALWRAFILRVLDGLYPRETGEGPWEERPRLRDPQGEQEEQVNMLQRLEQSVYHPVDWEELGRWTVNWWQAAQAGSEVAAEIAAAFIPGAAFFKDALAKVLKGEGGADVLKRAVHAYHLDQLASMEQFEGTFKRALELVLGKDGRLVVFVDDLDRCLPEKAVEVLEAIKLFLEVPGTVFVLGMDREVIERGIEARYAAFFRREGEERPELPIRGDVYLQKIVQIPFHLPPLAVEDLGAYILALEGDVPAGARLSEMTRAAFAHGLYRNPRQVKRALNIFRLLREIALAREGRPEGEGGLREGSVAWPLLAKTVLIQTQWPELYRDWRQYPTLVQTLEAEYARRPSTEEEALRGRAAVAPPEGGEEEAEAPSGGLLEPYLRQRRRYALLERMLAFPKPEEAEEGRKRARFEGLSREGMAVYVRLAGAVGPEEPVVAAPGDLLAEMLSGDRARVREAAARLEEQEAEREGDLHRATREQLLRVMREPMRPVQDRASAGDGLALVGDPRFRADAWYLPDEPLLGFVEIPEGPFLMGSDKAHDPYADDDELPQHEVTLPTYYIARYPVTVVQFRAFVQASGHQPATESSLRGLENHPVVRVTWRDALAYCRWLAQRLGEWGGTPEPLARLLREQGWAIMLPSEAEWEKAARGTDGRRFPWGEEADPNLANYDETRIGATSAVGCFPGGASPYGLEDLSGNVWEWTRSLYKSYPYDASDGREDLEAGGRRVVRGGSFADSRRVVRCAVRYWLAPVYLLRPRGFRPVAAPVRL